MEVESPLIQSKIIPKFDAGKLVSSSSASRTSLQMLLKWQQVRLLPPFVESKTIYIRKSIHLKRALVCRLFYASTGSG